MYNLTHNKNEASKNSKRKARANFKKTLYGIQMEPEERVKLLQNFEKVLDAYK